MLLHLPDGYTPELVRDALAAKIKTLPNVYRDLRSLLLDVAAPPGVCWSPACARL
jgi:hypothetical protein